MVYDRAMNLLIWITSSGQAYAVQRDTGSQQDPEAAKKLFHGHCFHNPKDDSENAVKVTVNARFSLLTVSCSNGEVLVYTAKDYMGNIPLSQKLHLPASPTTTGALTFMSYSRMDIVSLLDSKMVGQHGVYLGSLEETAFRWTPRWQQPIRKIG
jgi:hypothetical protein